MTADHRNPLSGARPGPFAADLYQRLGLSRRASTKQIHRAFRRLAMHYHPDRNASPSAAEAFIRLREAHDVLLDPERRAEYDRTVVFAPAGRQDARTAPAGRTAPQAPVFGGYTIRQAGDGRLTVTAVLFGIPIRLEFGGRSPRQRRGF